MNFSYHSRRLLTLHIIYSSILLHIDFILKIYILAFIKFRFSFWGGGGGDFCIFHCKFKGTT